MNAMDLTHLRFAEAGLTLDACAALVGYSARQIRRWEAAPEAAPPWYPLLLQLLAGRVEALPEAGPGWSGWRMVRGSLWSAEGDEVRAGDLRALPYLRALVGELQRERGIGRGPVPAGGAVVVPLRLARPRAGIGADGDAAASLTLTVPAGAPPRR